MDFFPSKLHHVTDVANLASILEEGLDPARSREAAFRNRSVYLAADAGHAVAYAEHGSGYVRFEIDPMNLDESQFGPDDVDLPDLLGDSNRDWREMDWRQSLEICGQCTYAGKIPADALELREMWLPPTDSAQVLFRDRMSHVFALALHRKHDMDIMVVSSPEGADTVNKVHLFATSEGVAYDAEGIRPVDVAAEWYWQKHGLKGGIVEVSRVETMVEELVRNGRASPFMEGDEARAVLLAERLFPFLQQRSSVYLMSAR